MIKVGRLDHLDQNAPLKTKCLAFRQSAFSPTGGANQAAEAGLARTLAFSLQPSAFTIPGVALVRILVDGYSLLHNWPQLAPGSPRYSEEARDELIHQLTLYRDAVGTPITIVFDGAGPRGKPPRTATPELEVIYSHSGQTADDIIERVTVRMQKYGEVLAVTDDIKERETVFYHGGMAVSCLNFITDVQGVLTEQGREIAHRNRTERLRFKMPR